MLQAVIFDFDGVITDSEILHLRAFNKALAQYNFEIPKKDYYRDYLGLSDIDLLNLLVDEGLLNLDENGIKNAAEHKKRVFEELARTEGNIIDGVRDFLRMLGKNNITMAICSGALLPEIELVLEQAKLRDFFDVIVSAEHVKKGKPAPDGFLLTLKKLNEKSRTTILPEHCIVIEDSHWGLRAAKAAKMNTVAITNSYDPDQLKPSDKTITHLSELGIEELQKLCR